MGAAVKRIRIERAVDKRGFSRWVQPVMRGYILSCCDCALCHEMDFRIVGDKVQFRARRAMGYTRAERKRQRFNKF